MSRSESSSSLNEISSSSIVFRPPRLRPPPVIVPPNLKIKLQAGYPSGNSGSEASSPQLPTAEEAMLMEQDDATASDEEEVFNEMDALEVEPPEKYGELSDDDDDLSDIDGLNLDFKLTSQPA